MTIAKITKATQSEALEPRQQMQLERPSFIKEGDVRGTENITSNDIKPPALRIAQSTTPETKRQNPAVYIEGLMEGMMFNSTSREIYGEGPVGLVIINQLGHRNIEFAPQSEGGGVLDFNVADDDARCQFTTGVKDGKEVRLKPKATRFYDYLVLALLEDGRRVMMTMSMKSTQLKKAKDLNTILKGSKMPAFAYQFNISAVPESRGGFSYYGWRIDPNGYVGGNDPKLAEEIYKEASDTYDRMIGKKIEVETEGADADEGEEIRDSDVPF